MSSVVILLIFIFVLPGDCAVRVSPVRAVAPLSFAVAAAAGSALPNPRATMDQPALFMQNVAARYGVSANMDLPADLGEGDHAEVRSGRLGGRAVAVKIPYLDPGGMAAWETRVSERLRAAGGAGLFVEAAHDKELGVIVMEKLAGYQTLDEWMARRVTRKAAARVQASLKAGLAVLERAGIVHSDLKPDNIMVGPAGAVRIVDFGIAAEQGGYPPYKDYDGWRGGHWRYVSPGQSQNEPAQYGDDSNAVAVILGDLERRLAVGNQRRIASE